MGKGSKPRPIKDKDRFEDNWSKIFGKPIYGTDKKGNLNYKGKDSK